jgi:adhesin/invasin
VDSSGVAYVTGYTSGGFPTTSGAFQTTFGGGSYDVFVTKLNMAAPTPAAIVAISGTPQSTIGGTAFGEALQAKVTDAGGNPLAAVTVTFTPPSSGASATLSATSVMTDSSGVASVTATANTTAGAYAVTASVTGVTPPATFNLTNLAGPVQTIIFVQQPSNTAAGNPISPAVTVKLTDASNNPIGNTSVTMSLEEAGVTLGGTLMQTTNAMGIAAFGDLKITKAGTYHLLAAAGGQTVVSSPFNITAGSAISITAVSG